MFKEANIDTFFPLEWSKKKMVEFKNPHQGGMSVKEYSLKFTLLSTYSLTIEANARDKMNEFMIGVSSLVEKDGV